MVFKIVVGGVVLLAIVTTPVLKTLRIRSSERRALKQSKDNPGSPMDDVQPTREALVDAALASPKYVGVHDKVAWLGLFASDGIIEDPVGSPASGPNAEERSLFYDTFIGPNQVALIPKRSDIVATSQKIVVRNLNIEPRFPNGALSRVPVHVVYRFALDETRLVVKSLAAHWEVAQNRPVLDSWGDLLPAIVGNTNAFLHIATTRGIHYTLEYLCGTMLVGAGRAEKHAVSQFAAAIRAGNADGLTQILAPDAVVSFPVQNLVYRPTNLLTTSGLQRLDVSGLRAGGEFVSCDFIAVFNGTDSRTGVGIFEFSAAGAGTIIKAELFWEDNDGQ